MILAFALARKGSEYSKGGRHKRATYYAPESRIQSRVQSISKPQICIFPSSDIPSISSMLGVVMAQQRWVSSPDISGNHPIDIKLSSYSCSYLPASDSPSVLESTKRLSSTPIFAPMEADAAWKDWEVMVSAGTVMPPHMKERIDLS